MPEYTVYEYTNDIKNRIGSVEASTMAEAVDKAHNLYGAPIKVSKA